MPLIIELEAPIDTTVGLFLVNVNWMALWLVFDLNLWLLVFCSSEVLLWLVFYGWWEEVVLLEGCLYQLGLLFFLWWRWCTNLFQLLCHFLFVEIILPLCWVFHHRLIILPHRVLTAAYRVRLILFIHEFRKPSSRVTRVVGFMVIGANHVLAWIGSLQERLRLFEDVVRFGGDDLMEVVGFGDAGAWGSASLICVGFDDLRWCGLWAVLRKGIAHWGVAVVRVVGFLYAWW